MEGLLEVLAGFGFGAEAGVAFLNFGEEALFGGEEEAGAVGVDAAAFEDEAVGFSGGEFDLGFELGDVVVSGDVLGIWSSRRQLSYLAQALNFQLVMARSPCGFLTKMGPESRSQTRSVCHWWKWRRARLAPARRRWPVARFSASSLLTRMWTSSTWERWRTISE